jgi:phosphoribosylaminoimidazolecarboxamide formyltransferase/IMP cyclohydrolase
MCSTFSAMKKRAFFSLFDKDRSIDFANQLVSLGWEVIATQESYSVLKRSGINAISINEFLHNDEFYPFPPTLHPKIELSLTSNNAEHIDLVYISTYPFSLGNDIGGHTILGLACKGNRIVVSNKEDMSKVIDELKIRNNEIPELMRKELMEKAYQKICNHYFLLSNEIGLNWDVSNKKVLRNGENPYQVPASFIHAENDDPLSLGNFEQISGNTPCYTNMADFDCILQILCSVHIAFKKNYDKSPYIAIAAKHGNPCGFAVHWECPDKAVKRALWGNPMAIWGGEFICNFSITEQIAKRLLSSTRRKELLENSSWMLDLVVAPGFEREAVRILGKRPARKLLKNKYLARPFSTKNKFFTRKVRGGYLTQPPHDYVVDFHSCKSAPTIGEKKIIDSLIIAWASAWFSHQGGNEVSLAKEGMLVGAGGGPSTVDSVFSALSRAQRSGHDTKGAAFAADAFFPYTDAPELLIKAGCKYGVVPEGGKNFNQVKSFFNKKSVSVFYIPAQFRGFYRH